MEYKRRAAWERSGKAENEHRAARERFPKVQNLRHAAWQRVFCPHGPDWCPQKGPPQDGPNHLFEDALEDLWSSIGTPELCTPKNGAAQVDDKERRWRVLKICLCHAFRMFCSFASASDAPLLCTPFQTYAKPHWSNTCF